MNISKYIQHAEQKLQQEIQLEIIDYYTFNGIQNLTVLLPKYPQSYCGTAPSFP